MYGDAIGRFFLIADAMPRVHHSNEQPQDAGCSKSYFLALHPYPTESEAVAKKESSYCGCYIRCPLLVRNRKRILRDKAAKSWNCHRPNERLCLLPHPRYLTVDLDLQNTERFPKYLPGLFWTQNFTTDECVRQWRPNRTTVINFTAILNEPSTYLRRNP